MINYFILILLFSTQVFSQNSVNILSWNVLNLGFYTKDEKIDFIVEQIKNADIVALQEVLSNKYGTEDFIKVYRKLLKLDQNWQYSLSGSTSGPGQEQYAFLWKKNKVLLQNKAFLDETTESLIDREPYLAKFKLSNKYIFLANFHAVPQKKQPWWEIKELHKIHTKYESENMIFMGDFNLNSTDKAYNELYNFDYESALKNEKTTIKGEEKNGQTLANAYDNFFYEKKHINIIQSGKIDFTRKFNSLKEARLMSDHLPVYIEITVK